MPSTNENYVESNYRDSKSIERKAINELKNDSFEMNGMVMVLRFTIFPVVDSNGSRKASLLEIKFDRKSTGVPPRVECRDVKC